MSCSQGHIVSINSLSRHLQSLPTLAEGSASIVGGSKRSSSFGRILVLRDLRLVNQLSMASYLLLRMLVFKHFE